MQQYAIIHFIPVKKKVLVALEESGAVEIAYSAYSDNIEKR